MKPSSLALVFVALGNLLFGSHIFGQTAIESAGFVTFEAEDFSATTSNGNAASWVGGSSIAGFSGTGYVEALPNNGVTIDANWTTTSPELQYTVNFSTTGTYYVWSRITASGRHANSYWLQVDTGCPIDVGDLSGMGTNYWVWVNYSNGNPNVVTALQLTAGTHLVKMYDREPGVDLDRLILTPDRSCVPAGTGDNCAGSPPAPSSHR